MQQQMINDYAKHDESFQTWNETMWASSIGIINSTKQLMKEGNLTDAFSLIANLDASNTQEENYKTVYTIYLHHLITDSAYSSTDSSALYNIAILNPLTNGTAVYSARNILFLEIHDSISVSSERIGKPNNKQGASWISVYPNPAKQSITFIASESINDYLVKIHDVSGRIVMQLNYKDHLNITNLEDGIYLAELTAPDKPSYKVKFIVSK